MLPTMLGFSMGHLLDEYFWWSPSRAWHDGHRPRGRTVRRFDPAGRLCLRRVKYRFSLDPP